jgi:bifunctional non-homologous end joining protein LigD
MAKKLAEYEKKRDFGKTKEPRGGAKPRGAAKPRGKRKPKAQLPRFVVQEHHARRLHWDLRLERDGVLASWAIPNGIPQDPKENRKAVHTEDHPLEYIDFEGDIPKGEYGAGTMKVWDSGTYEAEKFRDDEVIVTFHGERLTGKYVLFRAGKDEKDWMIHRMDPPADPERDPMPERLVPMLATAGALPKDEENWSFEIKWDGVRALVYSEPGRLRIEGRRLTDMTERYPELRPINRQLGSRDAILDGEIVAFDENGRPSFERLQHRMHLTGDARIKRRAKEIPVVLAIFDVLHLDGRDLTQLPYETRRAKLEELGLEGPNWRTPAAHPGEGTALKAASEQQGQELVIGGWLPGEGKRESTIGALLVGYYAPDGTFRYGGRAGSGFTQKALSDLEARLAPLRRKTSAFEGTPKPPKGAIYVEPELVCEVEYTDWTTEMVLRHPVFKGLCADMAPGEIVLGEDEVVEEAAGQGVLGDLKKLQGNAFEASVDGRKLRLSNLDKVLYPKPGFTKGQVIDYYARIGPVLIPHLHGRPLTLKRYPDGVEGEFFYEKQCPSHRPDWV